jgi:glycosyltransferase involved in cell wall biosynthesis
VTTPLDDATVTVVIPTWNRAGLLGECLASVLAQDVDGMAVLVQDNASTDETAGRVAGFADERIVYRVNDRNLGFFRNWKLGLEAVRSPWVAFLQDDDLWHPDFLSATLGAVHRSAGRADDVAFAFSDVELIDDRGRVMADRPVALPPGRFPGLVYLERVVDGENVIVDSSAAVMRTDALRSVGGFDLPHMTHDVIFNYQFRMGALGDLVRVPEPLTRVRMHPGQIHHTTEGGVAAIGMVAERMDAAALLLRSERAAEPAYRRWLADRLLALGRLRSQYTAAEVPHLTAPAADRLSLAVDDLIGAVPADAVVALAGDDLLYDARLTEARTVRPFPDLDGHFGGPPSGSAEASRLLAELVDEGVDHLAVAWPSFWWLDHYNGWRDDLAARSSGGRPLVDNSRIVVYRLRPGG